MLRLRAQQVSCPVVCALFVTNDYMYCDGAARLDGLLAHLLVPWSGQPRGEVKAPARRPAGSLGQLYKRSIK